MKKIDEMIDRLRGEMSSRIDDNDIVEILEVLQKANEEIERLQAFTENLQVVHFTELQREKATVERYEKVLKEVASYTKYEGNQWYEKAKKALEDNA